MKAFESLDRASGALVPGESPGLLQLPGDQVGAEFIVGQDALQFVGDIVNRVRIEQGRRRADNLGNAGRIRGDDRRPALHRLERRQAESFVEARKHKRATNIVEPRQLIVVDIAGIDHFILLKAEMTRRPL
jgi:hypothetical protein